MGLFNRGDRIKRWQYMPRFLRFTSPNKKDIDIPVERINELFIETNYEEYYFPVIRIKIVVNSDDYYEILERKNNCKINLRVDKIYFVSNTNDSATSVTRKYINSQFELILDENSEDLLKSIKEDENSSDYTRKTRDIKNDLSKTMNEVTLYLFKSNISGTKKLVNTVLTECNVADAVSYIATKANLTNVVMAKPDNIKIYDELLIPPMSAIKALEFVDLYYGLYKEGSLIFFGVNNTYIIPYNGRCVAYSKDEKRITNIVIPKLTNVSHDITLGELDKMYDKVKSYIIADPLSLNIQNQSISNDFINANNIEAVDSYDNEKVTTDSKAITRDENFVKVVENKTMNPYFANIYANQAKAKSVMISLRLKDYDIELLEPNKEFNVIFEDTNFTKKYNGRYVITGLSSLMSNTGGYLSIDGTVILKKME